MANAEDLTGVTSGLEKLAAELDGQAYAVTLTTGHGRPHLVITNRHVMVMTERVFCEDVPSGMLLEVSAAWYTRRTVLRAALTGCRAAAEGVLLRGHAGELATVPRQRLRAIRPGAGWRARPAAGWPISGALP
jgi:hypothetical protein